MPRHTAFNVSFETRLLIVFVGFGLAIGYFGFSGFLQPIVMTLGLVLGSVLASAVGTIDNQNQRLKAGDLRVISELPVRNWSAYESALQVQAAASQASTETGTESASEQQHEPTRKTGKTRAAAGFSPLRPHKATVIHAGLSHDERVYYDKRLHPAYMLANVLKPLQWLKNMSTGLKVTSSVLLVALFVGLGLLSTKLALVVAVVLLIAFVAGWPIWVFGDWYYQRLVVTNEKVVHLRYFWPFEIVVNPAAFARLSDFRTKRDLWANLLGYMYVELYETNSIDRHNFVRRPKHFKALIDEFR